MEIRGLVGGHLLAGVALLAACGGDDGGGALTEREYGDAVRAISERVADEVMDPGEVIGEAFELLSPEAAAGVLAEQLPAAIAAYERAVDGMDVLIPPETYAADHARLIAGRRDLVALLQRMLEAAEARDFLRVLALEQERRSLGRNLTSELSADFREFAYTFGSWRASQCRLRRPPGRGDGVPGRPDRGDGGVQQARHRLQPDTPATVQRHVVVLRRPRGSGCRHRVRGGIDGDSSDRSPAGLRGGSSAGAEVSGGGRPAGQRGRSVDR